MSPVVVLVLAFLQPSAFSLTGRVVDAMGAPVGGARATAAPDGRPASDATVTATDARGEFALALAPGRYTIVIAFEGFRDSARQIDARAGGSQSAQFVLQIAGVQESVTVSAAPIESGVITATKTATPLLDIPQSVTIVPKAMMHDQLMTSIGQVVQYVPGMTAHQGENNRDQIIVRGNSSSADFFVNGVRDDMQYYRDLYNLERVEALKGPNALIFGRGGARWLRVPERVRHERDDGRCRGRAGRTGPAPHLLAMAPVSGACAYGRRSWDRVPVKHVRCDRQHGDAPRLHTRRRRGVSAARRAHAVAGQRGERVRPPVLRQRRQQHEHLTWNAARASHRPDRGILRLETSDLRLETFYPRACAISSAIVSAIMTPTVTHDTTLYQREFV